MIRLLKILAVSMIAMVVMLVACSPASESTSTPDTVTLPAYPPAPNPTTDLSAFYGSSPPAAIISVGEQEQVAGVGTYTWIQKKKGSESTSITADAFALVTPALPLTVPTSFSAVLQLPIPVEPYAISFTLIPVTNRIVKLPGGSGIIRWQVPIEQVGTPLELKTAQEIPFSLEPGEYLMEVYTSWSGLGSVSYGFYLTVLPEIKNLQ